MKTYQDIDYDFELALDEILEFETGSGKPGAGASPGGAVARGSTSLTRTLVEYAAPDNFGFKVVTMPATHKNIIKRIAHLLVFSSTIGTPIRYIEVTGHTDHAGSDAVNIKFGLDRANDVRQRIINEMNRIRPGSSAGVIIKALSWGESKPVDNSGTAAGNALNRRVQILLPPTCQTMFAQLDQQTFPGSPVLGVAAHPNVKNKAERIRMVMAVAAELTTRRDRRAREALAGRVLRAQPLTAPAGSRLRKDVENISKLQLRLFRQYLPAPGAGFSPPLLTNCFQTFANGEMRSPHPDFPGQGVTEPDSDFFFLFAEFAFLCHDTGIEKASWLRALRSMVGAQEIFMHVYRKTPKARPTAVGAPLPAPGGAATTPLSDFSRSNFRAIGTSTTRGLGQSNAARKLALRRKYASMDIGQLYTAAKENLLRAQKL